MVITPLFLYITIYILISYIVLENGLDPLFFNCNNCNCNAGVITYSLTSTVFPTKPFLCAYLYPCLSTGQVAYGSVGLLYPDSDFLARYHLHATIHHIYLVESGMPDLLVYINRFGIAAYLGLGLLHGSFHL